MSQASDPSYDADLEQALTNSLETFKSEQLRRGTTQTRLDVRRRTESDMQSVRLERSSSLSEENGVVTTEVRPRSRPEGRKWEATLSLPPPPSFAATGLAPSSSKSLPPPPPKNSSGKRRGSDVDRLDMDREEDLISFISPNPDKSNRGIKSFDDLATLNSPAKHTEQIKAVQSLFRDAVPIQGFDPRFHYRHQTATPPLQHQIATPPLQGRMAVVPHTPVHTGAHMAIGGSALPAMYGGRLSYLGTPPPLYYNQFGSAVGPAHPGSSARPAFPQMQMYPGSSTPLSRAALLQNIMLNQNTASPTLPLNTGSASMVKSQSWSNGDPASSTPVSRQADFGTPANADPSNPITALSLRSLISPPPPSLRSSVSSNGSLSTAKINRRIKPKANNESLIDLDAPEPTTVSVLEEFDPLGDNTQGEEDIYWSSRESTSNYSESFYDSYDPFSYMADRAEIQEQQAGADEQDSDLPCVPPKPKKVGVVRPLPEVSEDKLNRRKTVARNYENIVKKDATFFQCIGVSKTAAVARDNEVLAFTAMVRDIRSKFIYSDVETNPGLVLGARLKTNYPAGTELKIVVTPRLAGSTPSDDIQPVLFTASVTTDLSQIIAKVLIELDFNVDDCEKYYLQVHGRGEYLRTGCLDNYEYVHHCYKYDRDVQLTLVHSDLIRRDLARTETDDTQDSELSYDQISPLDSANTLSHANLKTLLEFLQIEAEKISDTARNLATCSEKNVMQALKPKRMLQAVKAVCTQLGGVETVDLAAALAGFSQACVKFDAAKGNEDPAGRLRPEIVEEVGEIYAMVTLSRVHKDSFEQYAEEIKNSLKTVTEKVYSLIRTYSRTFRVDFSLEEIDAISPGESRLSTQVQETLLVRIGCLHRLDLAWEFQDYRVDLRIYHGTRLIRETHSTFFQTAEHSHQQLHRMVTFNCWIDMRTLSISHIPLEARLVLCLVGRGKDPENKDSLVLTELCWTALQLYSLDRNLSQGPYLLALWPMEVTQQIGPAPDSSSHPQADKCPLVSLELLDLGGQVTYPDLQCTTETSKEAARKENSLGQLDFETREQLLSMCEQDILTFHRSPAQDREILWEKRYYLRTSPGALPKVLLSVRSWDAETLVDLYGLLDTWPKPDIADILQLFLPIFPDVEVRRKAVEWLSEESTDIILDVLPQLVEAVKHETWTVSPLVRFLLERCLSSPMLTHSLYWLLTQSLPGVSPQNSDGGSDEKYGISTARHKRRLLLILRTLFVISGEALRNRFLAQQVLIHKLFQAADAVKSSKDSSKHTNLARHMENLHHQLKSTPTLVPLSASLTANGVDVKNCQHFNSNTFPLRVVLTSAEDDGGIIQIIYKVGDDLRQDMLTLQMIRVMDRLWLRAGLDLRIVYFSCVPTGFKSGIVEFVEDARTLREIQVEDSGVAGTLRAESLNTWLQKYNPSQLQYKRAVSNFTRSCAGYSVVTYVLGICDRHNDNIMLKTTGHLFHIDFGKFLGDAQKFGAIKRDRVPFVLTPDMVFVINGGKTSTERFHTFVEFCCQAFNVLRQQGNLILTLFALMASSGIPGVTKEAVSFVHERLLLDLSEDEAAARFGQLIQESINNSLSTQLNNLIHSFAQLKYSKGGSTEDNLTLSFIPNLYSLKSDGKIKQVLVHGIQKRYEAEKHYVFILRVSRQEIKDPSYIFRSYKQFCEFHSKLCSQYPLTKFHTITSGYNIGRSNIKEVAEKRKREIASFLSNLFMLAEEISHSSLVYTFFHPLLKDEEETSIHIQKLKDSRGHERKPSVGKIQGKMKLKVYYRNETLHVLIQFVENLPLNEAREEPNSYVKVYLHPDPTKLTKRKTKVIKRSCNPAFMEVLEYRTPLDIVRCRTLQATVWDSSQFQENMFLGSVTVTLDAIDLTQGIEKWFPLGQFFR